MKKTTLLLLLLCALIQAQNVNTSNFKRGIAKDLMERHKSNDLRFQENEMVNHITPQNIKDMDSLSYLSEVMLKTENDVTYRLDRYTSVSFNENGLSGKSEVELDTNDNVTLWIRYNWDTDTQSFVPFWKFEYAFDANGNRMLWIRYNWDTATQSFVPSNKSEFTYDANGNRTLWIRYNWDTATQSFVPSSKEEYAYDTNGNQTLFISYNWDTATQSFVPTKRDIRIYDYNFSPVRPMISLKVEKYYPALGVFKPSFIQEYSVHTDTETDYVIEGITKQYDTNFNTWNALEGEEFKSYWYYTKVSELSNQDITNNTFKAYPNPATNFITIDSTLEGNYNLVSMLGKTIAKGTLRQGDNIIDLSNFNKGIYFLNISSNNTAKTLKIVKE